MRKLLFIPLFFIATIHAGFKDTTNPVYVTGHIIFRDSSKVVRHMLVTVRGDGKKLAETYANDKGDFELTFTPKNEKVFKFYCYAPAIGTKLLAAVKKFESDTPEMTFYIPADNKNK